MPSCRFCWVPQDTVSIAETAQERVLGPHQELHYCNVALWAVAEGMAELAAGGGSGRLRKFTHALCEWVARAAARASQMLAQSSGSSIVLSGDTISFTNTLLVENFAWLTICLEVGRMAFCIPCAAVLPAMFADIPSLVTESQLPESCRYMHTF